MQDIAPSAPNIPYFTARHFNPPETYYDPVEDSDQLVRDANKHEPYQMPIKNHTIKKHKWQINNRIQWQKRLLNRMKSTHVTTIKTTTTMDSDDEGFIFQC